MRYLSNPKSESEGQLSATSCPWQLESIIFLGIFDAGIRPESNTWPRNSPCPRKLWNDGRSGWGQRRANWRHHHVIVSCRGNSPFLHDFLLDICHYHPWILSIRLLEIFPNLSLSMSGTSSEGLHQWSSSSFHGGGVAIGAKHIIRGGARDFF